MVYSGQQLWSYSSNRQCCDSFGSCSPWRAIGADSGSHLQCEDLQGGSKSSGWAVNPPARRAPGWRQTRCPELGMSRLRAAAGAADLCFPGECPYVSGECRCNTRLTAQLAAQVAGLPLPHTTVRCGRATTPKTASNSATVNRQTSIELNRWTRCFNTAL